MNTQDTLMTCDSCGSHVKALYTATLNDKKLTFCGSHMRANGKSLENKGFSIYPEDYRGFTAELKEIVPTSPIEDTDNGGGGYVTELSFDEADNDNSEVKSKTYAKSKGNKSTLNETSAFLASDPHRCIMEKIIPSAYEVTNYGKNVRVFIDLVPHVDGLAISIRLEPAEALEVISDIEDFNLFRSVFFSLMEMVTVNAQYSNGNADTNE